MPQLPLPIEPYGRPTIKKPQTHLVGGFKTTHILHYCTFIKPFPKTSRTS